MIKYKEVLKDLYEVTGDDWILTTMDILTELTMAKATIYNERTDFEVSRVGDTLEEAVDLVVKVTLIMLQEGKLNND